MQLFKSFVYRHYQWKLFSGTISNAHFSGTIVGSFYGPQAAEIGAIIRLDHLGVSGGDYETSGAFSMISLVGLKL